MDNETTRLINDGDMNNVKSTPAPQGVSSNEEKKRINPAVAAAGGFVAGTAAAAVGATAYASQTEEPLPVEEVKEEETETTENVTETPEQKTNPIEETPQQEPISSSPKAATVSHSEPTHHASETSSTIEATTQESPVAETVAVNAEMIDVEPVDNEIRILGVEAVQTEDGHIMNVAMLESGGDQALLVDVDNNGVMDVLLHDDNYDGSLQENEVHDISSAGIHLDDIIAAQVIQEGGSYYASMDDMPDYINDADSIAEV